MNSFTLHVHRQPGLTAAAAATKVIIDGSTLARLRVGGKQDFTLPRKPVKVTLLTQVSLGKDIEKTLVIDPGNSLDVTILFSYKFNFKSLIPFGAFTKQQAFISTEVIHGPSAPSPASAYSPTPGAVHQASSATAAEKKFCTECGTANPKTAKFCQGCGHSF